MLIKIILMRLLLIISFCFLRFLSFSQDSSKITFGINLSNNLTYLFTSNYKYNGGFAFEPVLNVKCNDYFKSRTVVGYTKTSGIYEVGDLLFSNQKTNYQNSGFYVKTGLFTNFTKEKGLFHNSIGLNLLYSNYKQSGDFVIYGNYFGDYIGTYHNQNQQVFAIEPSLDLSIFEHKYFIINANINFPIVFYSKTNDDSPNYFIPGIGRTQQRNFYEPFFYRFDIYLHIPIR